MEKGVAPPLPPLAVAGVGVVEEMDEEEAAAKTNRAVTTTTMMPKMARRAVHQLMHHQSPTLDAEETVVVGVISRQEGAVELAVAMVPLALLGLGGDLLLLLVRPSYLLMQSLPPKCRL